MKKLSIAALLLALLASQAVAQDPDWNSLNYTDHGAMQAVGAVGQPAYSLPGDGFVKLRGVILNNPADMADSTPHSPGGPFDLNPIWQIFVQSVDVNGTGDFGGTAVFMAQNYANVPPHLTFPGGIPTPGPASANYTNAQWLQQLDRVSNYNHDAALPPHLLQAGDLVEIRARGGMAFGGKFNVNEMHTKSVVTEFDHGVSFDIIYLGHTGLPAVQHVQLADLWDDALDAVKFDPTRATGGERYQSQLVSLNNVRLVDGDWNAGEYVTVADAAGRQFPLHLGLNSAFMPANTPDGWFNVVGIFNQEAGGSGPFTRGYELWVMDPAGITLVPEPSTIILALMGGLGLWIGHRPRRVQA